MIATVTLNAAIDKTYYVDRFAYGGLNRAVKQIVEPGGKGNNVANVIRALGGDVCASGFAGGRNGAFIDEQLGRRGIRTDFVHVPGESRLCLNVINEEDRSSTEILEKGPEIGATHIEALKEKVRQLAAVSNIVVLSGSLPPGAQPELYGELVTIARSAKARVYLDTNGQALRSGLAAGPDFAKPNEQELAQWLGKESIGESESEWVAAVRELSRQGIAQACATMGSRGAIAILDGEAYRVMPPAIRAVNPVGCGDAFVAGMAYAEASGESPADRLRIAAAAAASNAMSERAGHADYGLFQQYLKLVEVVPL